MRKSRPPPAAPDADDAELFRAAIGPVRELHAPEAVPRPPPPVPRPRQRERDEAQALEDSRLHPFDFADVAFGDASEYLKDGLSPRVLRRLKRGQYSVQDEIDLHGMTSVLAEKVLRGFLAHAKRHDLQCVRIVHGKGLRSEDGAPVLRALTERLLRQRADVLAFASAREGQGGTGAVTVLLAPRRPGEGTAGGPAT